MMRGKKWLPGTLSAELAGIPMPGTDVTAALSLPFQAQSVQGFSGIKLAGDSSYWGLTDNGFGNRRNSPDALLMFHRVRPDFATRAVAVGRTIFAGAKSCRPAWSVSASAPVPG